MAGDTVTDPQKALAERVRDQVIEWTQGDKRCRGAGLSRDNGEWIVVVMVAEPYSPDVIPPLWTGIRIVQQITGPIRAQ